MQIGTLCPTRATNLASVYPHTPSIHIHSPALRPSCSSFPGNDQGLPLISHEMCSAQALLSLYNEEILTFIIQGFSFLCTDERPSSLQPQVTLLSNRRLTSFTYSLAVFFLCTDHNGLHWKGCLLLVSRGFSLFILQ